MPSKMVLDHDNAARSVAEAADSYSEQIAAAVTARMSPHLARGEKMPDVALLVRLAGRTALAEAQIAVKADDAHEAELADDPPLRDARDRSAARLYETLVDLRDLILPGFGRTALSHFGLREAVGRDPKPLARTAAQVLAGLESKETPPPRRAGFKLDRKELIDEIRPELKGLEESLAALERESKEAAQTMLARNTALSAAETSLALASAVIYAGLDFAGLGELSAKVLPVVRSRPVRSQPAEGAEGQEPTEGST